MNWEVILWTSITIAFLLCVAGILLAVVSARNIRKKRRALKDVHTILKVGAKVMFAGGVYGRVAKIDGDIIHVQVSKGVTLEVSRYGIQNIET